MRVDGGRSGMGETTLPTNVQRWIEWRWQEIVTQRLGFESLDEMRSTWAEERKKTPVGALRSGDGGELLRQSGWRYSIS